MVTRSDFSPADRFARGDAARRRPRADDTLWTALTKAWRNVQRRLPELREDAKCYAQVQRDRVRLAATNVAVNAVRGVLLLLVAGAVFVTAATLTVLGIAGALAAALGGNTWLGNLLAGIGTLALLFGGVQFGIRLMRRQRLAQLRQQYARHDARDRAMAAQDRAAAAPESQP
jgi:hypothetical protein